MPVRTFAWMASSPQHDEKVHLLRQHVQNHPLLVVHLLGVPRTMLGIASISLTWRRGATGVESAKRGPSCQ